jgi:hypothetical protein
MAREDGMSVRTGVATAVMIAGMIAAALPAEAQAAGVWGGVWRGVGLQTGPGDARETWDIVMTLHDTGADDIRYPSLGCAGRLTELSRSRTGITLGETITSGPCIDGGTILARLQDGRLVWSWRKASEPVRAEAVLDRGDQVAEIRTRPAGRLRHPTS